MKLAEVSAILHGLQWLMSTVNGDSSAGAEGRHPAKCNCRVAVWGGRLMCNEQIRWVPNSLSSTLESLKRGKAEWDAPENTYFRSSLRVKRVALCS